MTENDDRVSVAAVSESTVPVLGSPAAADETLMEDLDGGDMMVEVAGADAFVDGVGGQGGGGVWNGDEGGGGLVRESLERETESGVGERGGGDGFESQEVGDLGGQVREARTEAWVEDFKEIDGSTDEQTHEVVEEVGQRAHEEGLERETESVDNEGGGDGLESREVGDFGGQVWEARIETQVEESKEIEGSSDEQAHVLAEEVAGRVNEEGLERDEHLDGRGLDGVSHDEAQNSEIELGVEGSLAISGSSCEPSEVVAEGVSIGFSEESSERGLAEKGVEKGAESVERGSGELNELPSQGGGSSLDDELWNPGIRAGAVCSSTQNQVAEEGAMMLDDEVLNHTDEAEEGNLTCSGNNDSSMTETICLGRDKDGAIHPNAESSGQLVDAAVGGELGVMEEEEILHPKGNLYSSAEDQQMMVETAGEISDNQGDVNANFIPSCEPSSAGTGTEVAKVDDKVSLNPNVGAPQEVVLGGVVADAGEVDMVSADSGSSIQQSKVAADYSVVDENKGYVEDQDLKILSMGLVSEVDAAVSAEPQSSCEQLEVVCGNEVSVMDSKVSNSEAEIPTHDTDKTLPNGDQNMQCEITCGIAEKDGQVLADPDSLVEQACANEIGEVAAMDVEEVVNIEGEVARVDDVYSSCSGKDQYLEVEKDDGSFEDNVVHRDLEPSSKQTQMGELEGEAMMEDSEKVSSFQFEVLVGDACLQKDEQLNTLTIDGTTEKDGTVQGSAEAYGEHTVIDNHVESSVLECQGIVRVPEFSTFDENVSLSVGFDSPPTENHVSSIGLSFDIHEDNPSLRAEKSETVAQLADVHTHEVGGDQSMNMLMLDGKSGQDEQQIHIVSSETSLLNAIEMLNSNEMVNPEAKGVSSNADEQVLNLSMVGSLVVDLDTCLNNDRKWNPQEASVEDDVSLRDQSQFISNDVKPQDESLEDNVSLPDQSELIGKDVEEIGGHVGQEFSDCLDGVATDELCLADSTIVQEEAGGEQYTNAEQVDLYGGGEIEMEEQVSDFEQANLAEDESSKQIPLKPGSSAKVHQSNYLLPPESEGEFSVSDLVWGKVRSHPWWPGQIFDPADASEKAMKYHKKDCFLVAYFGDRTFAWNDASLLKPFWTNFSQIERQSNSEVFQNAVSSALEEVSRRVELGIACSCTPKDVYDNIESQIVENAGIREESSRRYGVDKSTGVSSFKPDKLVGYIRALAQSASGGADKLELVIAKSQLLAFNRLKGFCRLPEFQVCGGLKAEYNTYHKRKHNLKDMVYPSKKERSMPYLVGDMASSPDSEDGSDWKASSELVSSSSGKKRKAIDDGSEVQDRRISIYAAKVSATALVTPKPSFKVGECIRRAASQLSGFPSIVKSSSGNPDVSLQTPDNSPRGRMIFTMEYSSLDEMLTQLYLAARDPRRGYSFLTTIITFFSGFRNSIHLGQYSRRQNLPMGKLGGGRKKKASLTNAGFPEEFEFDDVNDSYWTDRIIQNNSEEQLPGDSQNRGKYQLVTFDQDKSPKPSRRPYSRKKRFSNGNHEMDLGEPTGYIDDRKRDTSPAELVLNFSEGDSIPSDMNLNRIFRRFGPLKESETEVDLETSRARVVFKRGSDAEVAFSSSGKFNIFGPMIVNYQLSYSPSISFKTLPLLIPQDQEDAT